MIDRFFIYTFVHKLKVEQAAWRSGMGFISFYALIMSGSWTFSGIIREIAAGGSGTGCF